MKKILFILALVFIGIVSFGQTRNNNPNVFNVTLFGAKPDGKNIYDVSTTNGSATITSASANFTSADVGKNILVNGAGAAGAVLRTTISSFTNSTTVDLAATASATLTNDTTAYGTDNTAAINAAIAACDTAGGGIVWFPNGIYFLSTAVGGAGNSQIHLPYNASTSTQTHIQLVGESTLQIPSSYLVDFPGEKPIKGVILRSTVSGSGTLPSVIAATTSTNLSGTEISIKNISIQVYTNNGATAISMSGYNGKNITTNDLYRLVVAPDVQLSRTASPASSEVAGIIVGQILDNNNFVRSCASVGFKYGVIPGEHTLFENTFIYGNIYGIVLMLSGHAVTGHAQVFACKHEIYAPTTAVLGLTAGDSYSDLVIESEFDDTTALGGNVWYTSFRNITDSSNHLVGSIRINNNTGSGIANDNLIVYGAANPGFSYSSFSQPYPFVGKSITVSATSAQGIGITNSGSGNSAAGFNATNNAGNIVGINSFGSGHGVTNYAGKGVLSTTTGMVINSDAGAGTGGTSNIDIITGGLSTTTYTARFRGGDPGDINFPGKVGVGSTTAPTYKLDVSSSDIILARFRQSGTNHSGLNFDGASGKNSNIIMSTAGVNKWYFQNNGGDDNIYFLNSDANGNSARFKLTQAGILTLNAYGAGTATFDASGVISSVSDERVKNILGLSHIGLKQIMNINPIYYKYNGISGNETNGTYVGFSAQNVKANIPYSTGITEDGYLTLQDRAIMAAMVNAIKEQQKEIEELKKEVKQLKGWK